MHALRRREIFSTILPPPRLPSSNLMPFHSSTTSRHICPRPALASRVPIRTAAPLLEGRISRARMSMHPHNAGPSQPQHSEPVTSNTSKAPKPKPTTAPLHEQYYPSTRFSELGASRPVKVIVISVLVVLGTLESVFWTKTLWAYFFPEPSGGDGQGEGKAEGDGNAS